MITIIKNFKIYEYLTDSVSNFAVLKPNNYARVSNEYFFIYVSYYGPLKLNNIYIYIC